MSETEGTSSDEVIRLGYKGPEPLRSGDARVEWRRWTWTSLWIAMATAVPTVWIQAGIRLAWRVEGRSAGSALYMARRAWVSEYWLADLPMAVGSFALLAISGWTLVMVLLRTWKSRWLVIVWGLAGCAWLVMTGANYKITDDAFP